MRYPTPPCPPPENTLWAMNVYAPKGKKMPARITQKKKPATILWLKDACDTISTSLYIKLLSLYNPWTKHCSELQRDYQHKHLLTVQYCQHDLSAERGVRADVLRIPRLSPFLYLHKPHGEPLLTITARVCVIRFTRLLVSVEPYYGKCWAFRSSWQHWKRLLRIIQIHDV